MTGYGFGTKMRVTRQELARSTRLAGLFLIGIAMSTCGPKVDSERTSGKGGDAVKGTTIKTTATLVVAKGAETAAGLKTIRYAVSCPSKTPGKRGQTFEIKDLTADLLTVFRSATEDYDSCVVDLSTLHVETESETCDLDKSGGLRTIDLPAQATATATVGGGASATTRVLAAIHACIGGNSGSPGTTRVFIVKKDFPAQTLSLTQKLDVVEVELAEVTVPSTATAPTVVNGPSVPAPVIGSTRFPLSASIPTGVRDANGAVTTASTRLTCADLTAGGMKIPPEFSQNSDFDIQKKNPWCTSAALRHAFATVVNCSSLNAPSRTNIPMNNILDRDVLPTLKFRHVADPLTGAAAFEPAGPESLTGNTFMAEGLPFSGNIAGKICVVIGVPTRAPDATTEVPTFPVMDKFSFSAFTFNEEQPDPSTCLSGINAFAASGARLLSQIDFDAAVRLGVIVPDTGDDNTPLAYSSTILKDVQTGNRVKTHVRDGAIGSAYDGACSRRALKIVAPVASASGSSATGTPAPVGLAVELGEAEKTAITRYFRQDAAPSELEGLTLGMVHAREADAGNTAAIPATETSPAKLPVLGFGWLAGSDAEKRINGIYWQQKTYENGIKRWALCLSLYSSDDVCVSRTFANDGNLAVINPQRAFVALAIARQPASLDASGKVFVNLFINGQTGVFDNSGDRTALDFTAAQARQILAGLSTFVIGANLEKTAHADASYNTWFLLDRPLNAAEIRTVAQSIDASIIPASGVPGSVPLIRVNVSVTTRGGTVTGNGIATAGPDSPVTAALIPGSPLQLTANPRPGYVFKSWNGDCSGTTAACSIPEVRSDKTILASFDPKTAKITLVAGNGGSIELAVNGVGGLFCGANCGERTFSAGDRVKLTATPNAGATFGGWGQTGGGLCAGSSDRVCEILIDPDTWDFSATKTANATFAPTIWPLTVDVTSSAQVSAPDVPGTIKINGQVTSPATTTNVTHGIPVTVTAVPTAPRFKFQQWNASGPCAGQGATCTIIPTGPASVVADFELNTVMVSISVSGRGTVATSGPVAGAVNCVSNSSATCTTEVPYGGSITLTATPGESSVIGEWIPAACGSQTSCTLSGVGTTVTSPAFTARFEPLYTLTVSTSDATRATAAASSQGPFRANVPVIVTANVQPGNALKATGRWTVQPASAAAATCTDDSNSCPIVITSDTTVVANVEPLFNLKADVSGLPGSATVLAIAGVTSGTGAPAAIEKSLSNGANQVATGGFRAGNSYSNLRVTAQPENYTCVISPANLTSGTFTNSDISIAIACAMNRPTIAYAQSTFTLTKNVAIERIVPTLGGGPVATCAATPSLPAGLTLDPASCAITGAPSALLRTATTTITATNAGGTGNATLTFTVNDVPPGITVLPSSYVFTKGTTISGITPALSGGPVPSCQISPALSGDLVMDTSGNPPTCAISGTPTAILAQTNYTITTMNSGGSATASFAITVNDVAPRIAYALPTYAFTLNEAVSGVTVSSTGGAIVSCAIQPALPTGLTFDTTSCQISGTPTALKAATTHTVTATNSGGNATTQISIAVNDRAPQISYAQADHVFTRNTAITPIVATLGGGAVTSCALVPVPPETSTPSLPAGLALNATTCAISGTPTSVVAATRYSIRASNTGGSATALLNITVNDIAPQINYSSSPYTLTKNTTNAAIIPTLSGGAVVSCAVTPLPAGLALNASTCVISGVATALNAATTYTITATNSGGSASASVSITVNDIAPTITLSGTSFTFVTGSPITAVTPSLGGGPVTSCEITPALSAGLALSSSTCVISGTPTAIRAATSYTITARNSGGSAQRTLSITVTDIPPQISYATSTVVTRTGTAVTMTPTLAGGAVTHCSVTPSLPAGLSLGATSCVISGTPTAIAAQRSYTVTAENSGGPISTSVFITVTDIPPTLTLSPSSFTFVKNSLIGAITATRSSGGPVTSCSVSPNLPTGLSAYVTNGTCQITGTPTAISAQTSYTLTGTNSGGSGPVSLTITVNDIAPTITLNSAAYSFVRGSAAQISATLGGGAVTGCSVSPALPNGITFNSATCSASGTPASISSRSTYTITASNSGGSATATFTAEVLDIAPRLALATTSYVFARGTAITTIAPVNNGGTIVSCAISPALSAGLSLNTGNCAISGTPTQMLGASNYSLTATNNGGTDTLTITITVNDAAPRLALTTTSYVGTVNSRLLVIPTNAGGEPYCTLSPPLPGLTINNQLCQVSGTLLNVAPTTNYTINATNVTGPSSVTFYLTVNDNPPVLSGLSNIYTFTRNTSITPVVPGTIGGGAIVSCAMSPSIPAGLTFNTSTCGLSGTPTIAQALQSYTITATNSGGSGSTTFQIAVNEIPPVITITPGTFIFTRNVAISQITPAISGGPVTSCAIVPTPPATVATPLPQGLLFNSSNCVIYGTPSVTMPATSYTISASNSGGSATKQISIAVVNLITASVSAPVLFRGGTMRLTAAGGDPALPFTYTVSPANSGVSVDANGLVFWSQKPSLNTGQITVTATKSGSPGASASFMTNYNFADLTTDTASEPSNCATNPGRCSYRADSSGLAWSKTSATQSTWANACSDLNTVSYNGYGDWRLPTRAELQAAAVEGLTDLNLVPSAGMTYWTRDEIDAGFAWVANSPSFTTTMAGVKAGTANVICVRDSKIFKWTQYNFTTAPTAYPSGCSGTRYVGFNYEYNLWMGLVTCGPADLTKYKIYASATKTGTYYPLGDQAGSGQDHCELVNPSINVDDCTAQGCTYGPASSGNNLDLAYGRAFAGSIPTLLTASGVYYSVQWYQCRQIIPDNAVNLTVSVSGMGTVTRSPSQNSYSFGQSVTLTAQPQSGYNFTGWSGACSGTSATCTVTMTSNSTVGAIFAPACGGTFYDNACWYVTSSYQNCGEYCPSRGGVETAAYKNYANQTNGNKCLEIGRQFVANISLNSGSRTLSGSQPGCYIAYYGDTAGQNVVWYGPDSSLAAIGKICSCSK